MNALIVGVKYKEMDYDLDSSLVELEELCKACDIKVIKKCVQNLDKINPHKRMLPIIIPQTASSGKCLLGARKSRKRKIRKLLLFFSGKSYIIRKLQIAMWKSKAEIAYHRICRRAGSVRRGAVNHVRRGTEQH